MKLKEFIRDIVAILPRVFLQSNEYKKFTKVLNEYETWDEKELHRYQNREFLKILNHAYNNVPFYKKFYDENNIDIKEIKSIADIEKLPIINKEIVKKYQGEFIAKNYDISKLNETYTGGTTSSPMRFYNTKMTNEREKAVYNWIWKKFGYNGPGNEMCLILRGNILNDDLAYKYDKFNKYIIFNAKKMENENIKYIIDTIFEKNIKNIQAYPSLIYLVAKYINKNKLHKKVKTVLNIFCSSEKMFNFQRNEIKQAFNLDVVDYYGHNERTTVFYYMNGYYEEVGIYGITEIIDEKGHFVLEGQRGNIVGTSLNNYAFPLIRYNTYDSAIFNKKDNGNIIVNDIEGRAGDFLVTKEGKKFSPTLLEFAIDKIDNFRDIQLLQKSYEYVDVMIVPDEKFTMSDAEKFKKELELIVNNDILFKINIVDNIDKPKNSKSRFVVSKIT